jgi:hypothetical protein
MFSLPGDIEGKRNPVVETTGCKPKPTAYEKFLNILNEPFILL